MSTHMARWETETPDEDYDIAQTFLSRESETWDAWEAFRQTAAQHGVPQDRVIDIMNRYYDV